MNRIVKVYNVLLQVLILILSIEWLFGFNKNNIVRTSVNVVTFLFIIFTFLVSYFYNKKQKVYKNYILLIIYTLIVITTFVVKNNGIKLSYLIAMLSVIVLPMCLMIINGVKVSDRVYGLITIMTGVVSLTSLGNEIYIKEISYILIPLSFIIVFCEKNIFVKLLYVLSGAVLLDRLIGKVYITIFFVLIELAISVNDDEEPRYGIEITYLLIYLLSIVLIAFDYIQPLVPITMLIATIASRGFIKDRLNLLFTANDLSIGGIETSLVNLINGINYNKYDVTLMLENKSGELLSRINKEVYIKQYKVYDFKLKYISKLLNITKRALYSLFNYKNYDFSCCYATYSYCGNKITKISSNNSCIFVHGNYKYVYKNEEQTREFFDTRRLNEFRRIIFVSNESRSDYLELYPEHSNKTMVINNFVDVDRITSKSKEEVNIERKKGTKLLVFVGRLDEESKRITRILDMAKQIEKVSVWIIGDGKDKEMYEKIIKKDKLKDKVKLLGSIQEPYNYMEKADYIVLTSDYEGFPVVYLEALALNKEIITTIPVSDERIDIKKRANIISKDKYIEEVREIISRVKKNNDKINLKEIQVTRRKELEKLFESRV